MFEFIKKMFITLLNFTRSLACVAKVSDCTKCISLSNPLSLARRTFIHLNLEELDCLLKVSLDRCNGSSNTLDELSSKIWFLSETKCKSKLVWLQEEMNHLTLTKHFSWDCKCKLNVRECHSDQK